MMLDAETINAIADAVLTKLTQPQTAPVSELNKLWAKNPELLKEYSKQNRGKRANG